MHLAFAFGMVLGIFVVWWGMYRWEDYSPFDFGTFMVIGLYASIYYSISVILFPRNGSARSFSQIRRPFYAALVLYLFLELAYYQAGDLIKPSYYNYVWLARLGDFLLRRMAEKTLVGYPGRGVLVRFVQWLVVYQ